MGATGPGNLAASEHKCVKVSCTCSACPGTREGPAALEAAPAAIAPEAIAGEDEEVVCRFLGGPLVNGRRSRLA